NLIMHDMRKLTSIFALKIVLLYFVIAFSANNLQAVNEYNIIPYPLELIPQNGNFQFNKKTTIFCSFNDSAVLKIATQFSKQFKLVSGNDLSVKELGSSDTSNSLIFTSILNTSQSKEAYQLKISSNNIHIIANDPKGFFYALQTLYQLLPAEIYAKKKVTNKKWTAPCVTINDSPRFAYRGQHLDVCRHFFPIAFIKKYIDAMVIHKLNTFHWHLTDDQGWRIEIKKYPLLTEIGSKRSETLIGHFYESFPQQFDGKPYGGYYTQEECREIVAYAKERFITVIPEIELPGHAQAAIASYPFLSCNQDSTIKVATRWGIIPEVFCPRDTTFSFLENVLSEVIDIFPGKYIHIGGDECPKDRWKTCKDCQALIKKQNLNNEHELQSYFVQRIEKFINSKGRQIIGWDEILEGGLAPNATVMSWRGIAGGIAAAKAGHDVIMTPNKYCYFDHYQADPATEPMTIGGYTPLQKAYEFEPVPAELNEAEAKHILGAQANVWTEYISTTDRIEYMAYPRVAAISEVLWSSKENKNWDSFRKRLPTQFDRYKQLNIRHSNVFNDVMFSCISKDNQLQITLSCDNANASIYYTTNGKIPTMKDSLYNSAILLNNQTTITACAFVNGKKVGKPIKKEYIASKVSGLEYIQSPVNTWYRGDNLFSLTDGIIGNKIAYKQWVGIGKAMDGEILMDLKKAQSIKRFSVGLLNAPAMCGMLTPEIKLYGSNDSINFQLLAEKQFIAPTAPTWEMQRPELTFPAVEVRYLKLVLKSAGACPEGRPDRSDGSMIFMDEIGVW
ncbi:MAG: beta-N-acetylhexosaminidase, partial [Paludibacter sp.]